MKISIKSVLCFRPHRPDGSPDDKILEMDSTTLAEPAYMQISILQYPSNEQTITTTSRKSTLHSQLSTSPS